MSDDKTIIMGRPFRVAPGTRLNGIYEVESLIGTGGMSEIYKGRNIQTQDDVAIKVILPEFAQDEQMVSLFRREALTLNRLSNEAIVRYHVFSHDAAANLLYLAMEFVDGPTLRDSMKQRPLSQQEACQLISRVAAGMQLAHSEGVVHRDLSTDNIILAGNSVSKPKVIDFGIARSSEINDSTLIASGFAGKYNFVSPEQLGLYGGKVRETSDIYSLGLVFAAALLGRPLDMAGSHADVVMKRQSVPDLSMINPGVRPLIESMLQPRPAMRPQSMGDIVEALEKWLPARGEQTLRGTRPVRAKPVALAGTPIEPVEKKSRSGALVLLLMAASAAGGWYGLTQTAQGQKIAATLQDKIAGLSNEKSVTEIAPPQAPVNPATGKSEMKAGDPGAAPVSESITSEAAAQRDSKSAEAVTEQAPEAVETPAVEPPPPADAQTEVAMKAEPAAQVEEPKTETAVEPPKLPEKLSPSDWIAQYDGGPCFHVVGDNPRGGKMNIEGFGDRVEPFEELEKSFQTAFGTEPQIRLRAITKKQCPVVEFAHVSKSQMAFALKIDLLKAGEPVDASLSNVTAENIGVFVVTPDGIIVNVTSMSNRYEDEVTIQIPNEALASKAGGEYLLLAVASNKPLASLDAKSASDAAAFLESLRQEGKGSPVFSAVKYLRKK
jgi:eukaryotic-like serine/threonine-protein kinase